MRQGKELLCTLLILLLLVGCTPVAVTDPLDPEPLEVPVVLVPYVGRVEHVFIHPLLAYPEQAFDGDAQALGLDDWFITVPEFNRILDSLYAKGFILVDINQVYEEVESNGKQLLQRRELLLPEGKKPIILSIDDLNYNRYMIGNGMVHKLIVDEAGHIATYSLDKDGEPSISRTNECVPILDQFVSDHPDFSHQGAKGTLALTGYEGILGYRTNNGSPNREAEIAAVKPVIAKLKETGWNFASHSYGHPNVQTMTYSRLVRDARLWQEEVQSLVGSTQVYVYPFGDAVPEGSDKFVYLQQQGFKIFCAVGIESYEKISSKTNAVMTDRRHIDGITLRQQRERFLDLYDANEVIDLEARPQR